MSPDTVPPQRLWWLLAGFGIWCSALVMIYALHAVGCAFGWSTGPLRLALAIVVIAHALLIGCLWRGLGGIGTATAGSSETGAFVRTVALWSAIAALVTVVLTLGPVVFLRTCI